MYIARHLSNKRVSRSAFRASALITLLPKAQNLVDGSVNFDGFVAIRGRLDKAVIDSPLGVGTGHMLTESSEYGTHLVKTTDMNFEGGVVYNMSVFVKTKDQGRHQLILDVNNGIFGEGGYVRFDMITKQFAFVDANDLCTHYVEYPDGWFRISVCAQALITGITMGLKVYMIRYQTGSVYHGENKSVYVAGAQVTRGHKFRDFNP